MNENYSLIGMDIGGTNARAGLVSNGKIEKLESVRIRANGTVDEILEQFYSIISAVINPEVTGIGIAFPSIMDIEKGIVYDVQNIPAWKEVHLKTILEERFGIKVLINNDANCFALGEYYFGKGKNFNTMIGTIIGTGLGTGLIIDGKLHSGNNGGAGEFGMVPYRDHNLEAYCSGKFLKAQSGIDGGELAGKAARGDQDALKIFNDFGHHLGQAIKTMQYSIDPELIIFGGSVRKSYTYFKDALWQALQDFAFPSALPNIKIDVSEDDYIAIYRSAALHLNLQ